MRSRVISAKRQRRRKLLVFLSEALRGGHRRGNNFFPLLGSAKGGVFFFLLYWSFMSTIGGSYYNGSINAWLSDEKFNLLETKVDDLATRGTEIANVVNTSGMKITDIEQTVTNQQYGLQASWNQLSGLTLSFSSWLDWTGTDTRYTWREISNDVELTNSQTAQALVELLDLRNRLERIENKIDDMSTRLAGISGNVGYILGVVNDTSNKLSELTNKIKVWLHGVISGLSAVIETTALPFFDLCRADGQEFAGTVTIDSEFNVINHPSTPASGVLAIGNSFNAETGIHTYNACKLSDYLRFQASSGGSVYFFYSDELKQIIARPWRNDGRVYL